MLRWIAIMAAIVLAISAAYGQSSSTQQEQPTLPLGQGQMMGGHKMPGGVMGMDQSMMPMMQHMMGAGTMGSGMMGPGMMGEGMMVQDMAASMMCRGQMGMMGMTGSPMSRLEARLAFVKSELAIDQSQEAAWESYAKVLRAEAKAIPAQMPGMQHTNMAADFPARLDARVATLEGQLSSLKAVRDSAVGLYGKLNDEQRKKADALLAVTLCI